jgi:transposase-like protein
MVKTICPKCKSIEVVKRGFFQTEAHGKRQRYYCKACDSKFIEQDGFYRMRNSPQKITLCLDLFYKGISTRQIQSHLQAFYPHNSSWVSIYKWVVKYSKKIAKFTDNLKIKSSGSVEFDEMEYHRRKSHQAKRGIDKNWFIDCIDTETRFMVSSGYVKMRDMSQLKKIMQIAKDKTGRQIRKITTDGLLAYPKAINRIFTLKKFLYLGIEHEVRNASQGEGFNYRIERMHNSIRQRTKTFRGFHGSIESASAIMKGYEIYYNFIRKHLALGKTPSELALPELKLNGNKWLELINLSNKTL